MDFGTRRNRATSETVRISLSEGDAFSRFAVVVATVVLFMTDMVSVGAVSNFSCRFLSDAL